MKLARFPAAPRQPRKDRRVSPARAWRCRGGVGWLLAASPGWGSRGEIARPVTGSRYSRPTGHGLGHPGADAGVPGGPDRQRGAVPAAGEPAGAGAPNTLPQAQPGRPGPRTRRRHSAAAGRFHHRSLALAPFPTRLPALDSVPKLLAVSLRIQAFAAYD